MEQEKTPNYKVFVSKDSIINIDGSILEGGGQILRLSVALSFILNKQIHVSKIRANRNESGLKSQHLACLKSICEIYNCKNTSGLQINSKEIQITPTPLEIAGTEQLDCKVDSAGSIGLMIQQTFPCLLFTKPISNPSQNFNILFKGGTITSHSPTVYYLQDVLFPILQKHMGVKVKTELRRNGLFPIGGGICVLDIQSLKQLRSINVLEKGKLISAKLRFAFTENMRFNVDDACVAITKNAKKVIRKEFIDSGEEAFPPDFIQIDVVKLGKTSYTFLYQVIFEYENTTIKGEFLFSEKKWGDMSGKKIVDECLEATDNAVEYQKICFDEHTVDHLIIFMALAQGVSKISVGALSMHTKTAIEIVRKFIPEIKIEVIPDEKYKDKLNVIQIEGIGYNPDI